MCLSVCVSIFYQLIAAASDDSELAASLGFSNPHIDFHYARRNEVNTIHHVDELEAYHEVVHAMEVRITIGHSMCLCHVIVCIDKAWSSAHVCVQVLGMSAEQRFAVLRVVAGVLLLGNIGTNISAPLHLVQVTIC